MNFSRAMCSFAIALFALPASVVAEESVRPNIGSDVAMRTASAGVIGDSVCCVADGRSFVLKGRNLVYIDERGSLIGRDVKKHKSVWERFRATSGPPWPIAAEDWAAYYVDNDGRVAAIDMGTGKSIWASSSIGRGMGRIVPIVGSLYVNSAHGLVRVREDDGKIIWTSALSFSANIAVTNKIVAVSTAGGTPLFKSVAFLDTRSGEVKSGLSDAWQQNQDAVVVGLVNGKIAIAATNQTGTIDEQKAALRVAFVDSASGALIRADDFSPDPSTLSPDTMVASNTFVSDALTTFSLGGVAYVYNSARRPATQTPIRIDAVPVQIVGSTAWFVDKNGARSIRFSHGSPLRELRIPFAPADLQPSTFTSKDNLLAIVTGKGDVVEIDLNNAKSRRFGGTRCSGVAAAQVTAQNFAVFCDGVRPRVLVTESF